MRSTLVDRHIVHDGIHYRNPLCRDAISRCKWVESLVHVNPPRSDDLHVGIGALAVVKAPSFAGMRWALVDISPFYLSSQLIGYDCVVSWDPGQTMHNSLYFPDSKVGSSRN